MLSDLRRAIRALLSARAFTAIALVTLSVGLALCITVLTVVNAYVIRALPYPAADRLYRVDYAVPGQSPPRGLEALDWGALEDVIEHLIAWDLDVFYLLGDDYPEAAPGAWITPGYAQGFGIRTALGRSFEAADYRGDRAPVAIISHKIWQARFGGDANVLGRTFQAYVSDRPEEPETFTIIGVLPADLWHFNTYTEILAPLRAASYPYLVRLRPGVTAAIAEERITSRVRAGASSVADDWHVVLTSQQAGYVAAMKPMLTAVAAGAGLVLLIAAANVAVLLLVRSHRRQKELAVCMALGASRSRLARLLILEGFILGISATIGGIIISRLAMGMLAPEVEGFLERRVPGGIEAFALDLAVLIAASSCGLLITIVFTLIPLATALKGALSASLSNVTRGATDGPASRRARSILIGTEVAASLTLLAGAALMTQSALGMLQVDFGIHTDDVVTTSLSLRQRSYPDGLSRSQFYDQLTMRLRAVPAASIALGDGWPLQAARPRRVEAGGTTPIVAGASVTAVSDDYFSTLGVPLHDGRSFTTQDTFGGEPVIVVSDALARRLWPGERALGQRLTLHSEEMEAASSHRVIGVVGNVRQTHTDTDLFDAYVSLRQRAGRFAFIYLRSPRTASWEAALRSGVASVDRGIALGAPRSLVTALDQERVKPRFLAFLLTTFAAFASVLALVGMHGVIAYAARQRQREIAVRMAVGADPRSVITLFLRQGSVVLVVGIIAGTAGAIALGRVLQSQLHGVDPGEPRILAGAALAFGVCGLCAMWWPSWRAALTDPALILKEG
jgi:putative ABC transport system permease protein